MGKGIRGGTVGEPKEMNVDQRGVNPLNIFDNCAKIFE